MLFKITLGALGAALLGISILFYVNNRLAKDLATEEALSASLATQVQSRETEITALKETAEITDRAMVQLRERATKAEALRGAILAGDTEALTKEAGSVGEALRLLQSIETCKEILP